VREVRTLEWIAVHTFHEGKHKKQSGGHGQFGVCVINVAPTERGAGFEFVDKIVGGAISRSYIPAVQKGIGEAMSAGGVFGHPVVDVRVELTDGKEHNVDSSEMAFKIAGRLAIREALAKASPVLLEPVSLLEVTVPMECQGDVMGDLNARRGRVQGTEAADAGEQTITAIVPTSEILRYAVELRSITGGRGTFVATHDHYDVLPAHLVDKVRREARELD
jgi:elongation factor G